jgi:hypothetical protein
MKILTNYDFNQNQLVNAVIQKLATPPVNPVSGQLYFDTAKKRLFAYNGTEWIGADALDAMMTGESIVDAINGSTSIIDDDNLSQGVRDAVQKAHDTHSISDVTGLQNALDGKVDDSQVLTDVPANAKFTDTVTTINGKTGTITKADITALGIPAQDTVYTHPTSDGNKHVPATGTTNSGKVLKAGATAGSLSWEDDNDTITTINGKTGAISKADIVALGIPAQDTTYTTFTTTKDGLVPKTTSSNTTDYLRRDGTWASPPDTKYTLPTATSTVLGGIKSGTDITVDASGNVSVNDNSHEHTIENVTGLQDALDAKETPSGATAKASTAENNAKGYTDTKIAELVGSAPETLDTLHELAEALGSDPNFATTITNTLAQKTNKFTQAIGDGVKTSYVITHNLNSRDVVVTIRETASPYEQVITDIEFTTVNTVTVKFAKPPTADQYTITLIG